MALSGELTGGWRRLKATAAAVLAALLAALLITVGGAAAVLPASALPAAHRASAAPTPVARANAAAADPITLTVTSSAGSTELPPTGSVVTFTYRVVNNTGEPAYYRSLVDSGCSSPTYRAGGGMVNDGTRWWIPAGGTAVFTCGTLVTQDLSSKATATFDTSPGGGAAWTPFTVTVTTAVGVAADPCTTIWYASNTYAPTTGTIGTMATSGTSATSAKYRIANLGNGANFPDSSSIAIDPGAPNTAYYIPRFSGGNSEGLWSLNLTTGASARVTAPSAATISVRLAMGRDGTVWSWASNGTLYSLARGSQTWVGHTIASAKDVKGTALSTTSFASGDLAVGGNGNLWMLAASDSGGTYLLTVPASESTKPQVAALVVGRMNAPAAGGFYNGIAFGPDGTLYASSGPVANSGPSSAPNTLYKVDPNTGASSLASSAPVGPVGAVGDIGSCALPRSELRVLKTDSTATPSIKGGDTITYTIQVANLGKLSAVAATLTDAIPANTTYVANSTTLNGSAVPDPSGGVMPYTVSPAREVHGPGALAGVVPAGGTATVTFAVRVNTPVPAGVTVISNKATVVDMNGPVASDDPSAPGEDDPTTVPIAKAGVAIAKSASTAQVAGSGEITYTFVVSNTGNDPLAGVRVRDVMTETSSGSSRPIDSGSCATPSLVAGSDVNRNGTLDPLEPWTYTCTQPAAWAPGDPAVWQIDDTATVTATGSVSGVTVTGDDSALVKVVPKPLTLDVHKDAGAVVGPDSVTGVLQATYTVSVTNSGQVAGSYGPLTDTPKFAAGLTPVAARWQRAGGAPGVWDGTWDGSGDSFAVTTGTTPIAAGATHDYKVIIDVVWTSTQVPTACSSSPGPGQGLFNSAALPAGQEAETADNNGACIEPPAPPAPKIEVVKKAGGLIDRDHNGTTSAGDTISYTFLVTNRSKTLTLRDITVTDPMLTGTTIECADTELAIGASTTCAATEPYELTQADIDRGKVENTATASGKPANLPVVTDTGSSSTSYAPAAALTVQKKATPSATPLQAGNKIAYEFTVTNTGSASLSNVAVRDTLLKDKGIAVACTATTLAPTASTTCTAASAYTVTAADITAGGVTNVATATAQNPQGDPQTSPPATVTTPVAAPDPKITLDKAVTGVADSNGNGYADAGDLVTYTFTVKNTGNVPVQTIYVDDDTLNITGQGCRNEVLTPGESVTCTGLTLPLGQPVVDAGSLDNKAIAYARYIAGGTTVSDDATAKLDLSTPGYPATTNALTLVKKHGDILDTDSSGGISPGDAITYSFSVKNTGSQTLRNIVVNDPGLVTRPLTCVTDLAPGETGSCLARVGHRLTQAEIDAGTYVNKATASGAAPNGATVTSLEATDTTPIPNDPELTLEKLAGPVHDTAGSPKGDSRDDTITYTFRVRNPSSVAVSSVKLTDPLVGLSDATCESDTIAPGGVLECTGTHTITRAEVNALAVVNTATVTGTDVNGRTATASDTVTTTLTPLPAIAIAKAHVGGDAPRSLGDTVDYTFTVTNAGAGTLREVRITDAFLGIDAALCVESPAGTGPDLPSGDSLTCTLKASYQVGQADVDAAKIVNTATVAARTAAGARVSSSDDDTVSVAGAAADIALEKAAGAVADTDGNARYSRGDTVNYTFTVTNSGPVTVNDTRIDDAKLGLSGFVCSTGPLAPGAAITCTSPPYQLTDADIANQQLVNNATATARASRGADPTATDSVTIDLDAFPQVSLVKSATLDDANGNTLGDAGETIAYGFVVTNNGRTPLTGVTLNDPMLAALTPTCDVGAGLAPQASVTCAQAQYRITTGDVSAGQVRNVATATGQRAGGTVTPASPESTTTTPTVAAAASVTLSKSARLIDGDGDNLADAGERIVYGFVVTNSGNVPVTGVSVSDPMLLVVGALVACPSGTLAPGASLTCDDTTYVVTGADIARGTPIVNTGVASADALGGQTDPSAAASASTPVQPIAPAPGLRLVKTASLSKDAGIPGSADARDEITYRFVVTNTGLSTISSVSVNDPMLAAAGISVTCPGALAAGASLTCTAPAYVVTPADVARRGPLANTATASGGGTTSPAATATVPLAPGGAVDLRKTATLSKDAGALGVLDAGDEITYGFAVTNTGATVLDPVKVTDPLVTALACTSARLEPGASTTCTASPYVVTPADAERGTVTNTASVSATSAGGGQVTATDTAVMGRADPRVDLVKSAEITTDDGVVGAADAGDVITYAFVVTNTGNVALTAVALSDPRLTAVTCPKTTLAARTSMTCSAAPYRVTAADVAAGASIDNTATVTGRPPQGDAVSANGTARTPVAGPSTPAFSLTKGVEYGPGVNPARVVPGNTLIYTFAVVNTGNVRLAQVGVDDPRLAALGIRVNCPATVLAPGEKLTCRAQRAYTVTAADAGRGSVPNTAVARAEVSGGNPVTTQPTKPTDGITIPISPGTPPTDVPTTKPTPPNGGAPDASKPDSWRGAPDNRPTRLAYTGAAVLPTIGLGIALLAAGAVLLLRARRRSRKL